MPHLLLLPLFAVKTEDPASQFIRLLTVFLLAMWVGFEVIMKVPQRLHTPLTSGSASNTLKPPRRWRSPW